MSFRRHNSRKIAASLMLGLATVAGAACAPAASGPPFYGIRFSAPSVGYVGKQITLTATATSGLPVEFTLDATSNACTLVGANVITFDSVGDCVINANQAGDATHPAAAQVQRTIKVYNCPPLISGVWSGPNGLTADVTVSGSIFTGTIDLTSMGYGVQAFAGSIDCQVVHMTFNNVPLTGTISPDGQTITSSYNGISIVLHAPVL